MRIRGPGLLAGTVLCMLAAGVYVLLTGGVAAASPTDPAGPSTSDFGFALAAGAIALTAALLLSRPRFRFRR